MLGSSLIDAIDRSPAGSDILNANDDDFQKAVAGIVWYFMALAIREDEGFAEGSFRVSDPDQKLYAFLNRQGMAYWRPCSHETHLDDNDTRGIDVNDLPAEMGHVLFKPETLFANGEKWLMLKPEPHGFSGVTDGLMHMGLWGVSIAVRWIFPGSNQGEAKRKERIPEHLIMAFRQSVSGLPGADEAVEKAGNELGFGFGIQAMHAYIMQVKEGGVPEGRVVSLNDFHAVLQKYKHPECRIGEEFIIRDKPKFH